MDKKKYPLKIMFAKKRDVIEPPPSDDESEDISRDSFVSLKGSQLYDLPEKNLKSLNNRDLCCKSEELEAALKNLNQKFKKERKKFVERAKRYKEEDQKK